MEGREAAIWLAGEIAARDWGKMSPRVDKVEEIRMVGRESWRMGPGRHVAAWGCFLERAS